MLLEIASGERPYHDGRPWVHHDARPLPDIEICCDVWDLPDNSSVQFTKITEIRATHFLEHFSHNQNDPKSTHALCNMLYNMLEPDGTLYVEVPHGSWQVKAAASGEIEFTEFVRLAYGDQDYPGNAHFVSFSPATLETTLLDAGFVDVVVDDIGMVLCAAGRKI